MEATDVTIAGFKGKKTDIEYSDEGIVLRDISYYLDTGEVYLFINQSVQGKKVGNFRIKLMVR